MPMCLLFLEAMKILCIERMSSASAVIKRVGANKAMRKRPAYWGSDKNPWKGNNKGCFMWQLPTTWHPWDVHAIIYAFMYGKEDYQKRNGLTSRFEEGNASVVGDQILGG
ncbi:hypothetical protein KP509_10G060300 [Ceratopteris richardii]|uniref:Uncharacterized protein n=1 Tax=Ceratopteris richardii TaxID=49495 RepID=A0A8T2U1X7_CERRI|nr:hypothetical protein KP509_10G060300 [Ceratopteris richardii]